MTKTILVLSSFLITIFSSAQLGKKMVINSFTQEIQAINNFKSAKKGVIITQAYKNSQNRGVEKSDVLKINKALELIPNYFKSENEIEWVVMDIKEYNKTRKKGNYDIAVNYTQFRGRDAANYGQAKHIHKKILYVNGNTTANSMDAAFGILLPYDPTTEADIKLAWLMFKNKWEKYEAANMNAEKFYESSTGFSKNKFTYGVSDYESKVKDKLILVDSSTLGKGVTSGSLSSFIKYKNRGTSKTDIRKKIMTKPDEHLLLIPIAQSIHGEGMMAKVISLVSLIDLSTGENILFTSAYSNTINAKSLKNMFGK